MKKPFFKFIILLVVLLFFILLNFFIHVYRTNVFNKTERNIQAGESVENCVITVAPRGGITDTWDKVDVDVDGRITTLQGVTYDFNFYNQNNYEVSGWTLKINIDQTCFINNAWCGTMEIHQFTGDSELVQEVDLRNINKAELLLDYIMVGQDLLIRLKKGDYIIYHPDTIVAEENIVPAVANGNSGRVTTGFILYYEKLPGLSPYVTNYEVFYKFRKSYFYGTEARIFIILFGVWVVLFIIFVTTFIVFKYTRDATEKQIALQRMAELEQFNKEISEANRKLEESHSIIKAVANIYYVIYSANLKNNTFYEIKASPRISQFTSQFTSAKAVLAAIPAAMFEEEDLKKTEEFYNLDGWTEKLKNINTCYIETRVKGRGWVRTNLIVSKRDENGFPENVICALQDVNEAVKEEFERKQRLEEANRIIKSYNQELNAEVENKTAHIKEIQSKVVRGLANVIGNRDMDTVGHVNRTSDVINIIVEEYRKQNPGTISDEMAMDIVRAAPMHDLGKIYIDTSILCKPGRFTDDEYAKMKQHSSFSGDIVNHVLKDVEEQHFVKVAFNVARFHHERWDGKGYPDNLSGENIPLEARIMAIADVYDALVSKRCYKEPMSFEKASSIMIEGMGSQFDPSMKSVFLACQKYLENYYTNSNNNYSVEINNQ